MQGSAEGTVPDLERVRYVTKHYEQLQGLRYVPIGLVMLAVYAFRISMSEGSFLFTFLQALPKVAQTVLLGAFLYLGFLILAVEIVLSLTIGEHYRKRFGNVERRPLRFRRWVLIIAAALSAWLLVVYVSLSLHPPVDVALFAFGLIAFVISWPNCRFKVHQLLMATASMGASFLPLLGLWSTDSMQQPNSGQILPLFAGLYLVVTGIFDHLLLVRTMKSLPEEDDGGAV